MYFCNAKTNMFSLFPHKMILFPVHSRCVFVRNDRMVLYTQENTVFTSVGTTYLAFLAVREARVV